VGDVQALKNKIIDHYYNTEVIKQMGQNARKFVIENFSAKAHLDKIREIYQMLIK